MIEHPPMELWEPATPEEAWATRMLSARVDGDGMLVAYSAGGVIGGALRPAAVDPYWETVVLEWFRSRRRASAVIRIDGLTS